MTMFATRSELFSVGRAAVAGTPNIRLNPAVADIPGSDLNLAIGIDSVIGEEVVSRGASAMRGAFAETARGAQLDRVAYDRYGLRRFSGKVGHGSHPFLIGSSSPKDRSVRNPTSRGTIWP